MIGFLVFLLVIIGIICLIGLLVAADEENARLREKADAYDRLRQMDALRGETRDHFQQIVQAHAREADRIVREAGK